ncbi:hypothetical protein B0H19DRAFT_1245271 [Mycena capillaripes]|nr:hypothetical protein B0H19DRAFT_1245271 [Mycena capillaripes]
MYELQVGDPFIFLFLVKLVSNYRHRKMGCDGERPICRRCRLQPPRSLKPCKYSHAPAGDAEPEEIEADEELNGQIILTEPYRNAPGLSIEPDVSDNPMPPLGTPSPIFGTPSPIEELPELTGPLMDIFFRHFARNQFFFLDPAQFQHSVLFPLPFDHPDLPLRALLNVVFLWATHVSAKPLANSTYSEEELLARTVYHLACDVAATESLAQQQRILYIVQAEVLLSLYYLDSGRLLESNYHRAGVTSLAFTAGLHQLGTSSRPLLPSTQPVGIVREKVLVNAFWSAVILNNYCVAASGVPSSIPWDIPVSTPWPTDTPLPSIPSSGPFLGNNDVVGQPPLTLLAKASILLERTIAFTTRNTGLTATPEFLAIGHRLENFRGQLSPIDAAAPTEQLAFVTHVLVNVAILRLYAPYSATCVTARFKCLTAASDIAARLLYAHVAEWEQADPILGPLLAAVADVFIANLPAVPPATDLQTTLSAMHALAQRSPLIQQHFAATQQRYTSAQQSLGFFQFGLT